MAVIVMLPPYTFTPIGYVRCPQFYRYESPRQGVFTHAEARIELEAGHNFEQALEDLAGFDRIWVLFVFHLNERWNPKVAPPVAGGKQRYGVFSTRSPHRPNPIGMSCVELVSVDPQKRILEIRGHDLLDRTPVLDIKPYIPLADAFPEAKAGWRDTVMTPEYEISFTSKAEEKSAFVFAQSGLDLKNFCQVQLAYTPFSKERKRIEVLSENHYSIGCRTWRVFYECEGKKILVTDVVSHYKTEELAEGAPDPYEDKEFHRAFCRRFG